MKKLDFPEFSRLAGAGGAAQADCEAHANPLTTARPGNLVRTGQKSNVKTIFPALAHFRDVHEFRRCYSIQRRRSGLEPGRPVRRTRRPAPARGPGKSQGPRPGV